MPEHPAVVIALRIARRQLYRLIIIRQRTAVVVVMIEDNPAIDVVSRPLRPEVDRLRQLQQCLIIVLAHEVHRPQCRPVGGVLRVQLRGAFKRRQRAGGVLHLHTYRPFLEEQRSRFGLALEQLLHVRHRFVEMLLRRPSVSPQ